MTRSEVLEKFRNITIWKNGDIRAPHKPLLILLSLAEYQKGNKTIRFKEVEDKLNQLLFEFGSIPNPRSYYPFVRLSSNGIWTFNKPQIVANYQCLDPSSKYLTENDISGFFTDEIQTEFDNDPSLIIEIALEMLDTHFPDSLHDDIMDSIGFLKSGFIITTKRKHDPAFREKVLIAYEYQCAICGFNVRLGNQPLALEAAHIQWHQAGGPDVEENGLALCSLHHKLFDLGAFTLDKNLKLSVSEKVNGTVGKQQWLIDFHNKKIRTPQSNNL
jgi:putative restriction endonuclease